jgi:hypothetical protein
VVQKINRIFACQVETPGPLITAVRDTSILVCSADFLRDCVVPLPLLAQELVISSSTGFDRVFSNGRPSGKPNPTRDAISGLEQFMIATHSSEPFPDLHTPPEYGECQEASGLWCGLICYESICSRICWYNKETKDYLAAGRSQSH